MGDGDAGRQSEARTLGKGHSPVIPNHAAFMRFTYTPAVLSSGVATEKPFYCYDAEVFIFKGACDWDPVAAALAPDGLQPMRTPDGRAMASIWINDLRDTVIGPYREVVISFDATRSPASARFTPGNPYGLLYDFFGQHAISYLHTLYITSPLSIMWGREMQAFPKHLEPARIDVERAPGRVGFDVRWGDTLLLAGSQAHDWGAGSFLKQAAALMGNFGPVAVTRFLASSEILVPIVMPGVLKQRYGVAPDQTAHILKGLDPVGIRAWPWGEGDRLELGTGLESRAEPGMASPTDLLARAGFRPQVVVHVPSLQMVVTDDAP